MARVFRLLVILLVATGCASPLVLDQDGALAVVPRQFGDTGHIVVEVLLDGQGPYDFALDTGASISVVFEKARADATIEPLAGKQVHVSGMTGSGYYPIAHIAEISVGTEKWRGARVALLPDDSPVAGTLDGILGVDFLSRYAVHYSQRDRAVRLYPRRLVAERSYLGWTSIPLFELGVGDGDVTMLAFQMYIAAEPIPALFDLGATVNLMNRRAARRLDVPVRRPRDVPTLKGVTGEAPVLTELIVWQLRIEDNYWRNRTFLIGDFAVFDALDANSRPLAIAGTNLFRERDFIIDFERKRLLVRLRQ